MQESSSLKAIGSKKRKKAPVAEIKLKEEDILAHPFLLSSLLFKLNTSNHALIIFYSNRLLEVRGRLYELLTHCIPPEIIIKVT